MRLAVIIPVLNEATVIVGAIERLGDLRARGARVIVVDGGSHDDTVARAAAADRVVGAARGRALQMNAGARTPEAIDGDVLLFLHADTRLPPEADRIIFRALANSDRVWGRFDVSIAAEQPRNQVALRVVSRFMNWRSRLTGIATGDQAIFIERSSFVALDGFAPIPLMEDVEFCRRARRLSRPIALPECVSTSGRRWEKYGVLRTIMLMWRLRAAYFLGADPAQLLMRYRNIR
ncbi:MAG: TIGR04283 family arsenosugar biosynthesis glycosyltransferase [Gemmatimonadota bacterium]